MHTDVTECYNNLGVLYTEQGEYAKALEYHEKSLQIRLALLGETHTDVAVIYTNIGLSYYSQGEYVKALENCEKALNIATRLEIESWLRISSNWLWK